MARDLSGAQVTAELHDDGAVTLRWPLAGVGLGPWRGQVTSSAGPIAETRGSWTVEAGRSAGGDGTWARWSSAAGAPGLAVHVPAGGPVAVVELVHVPGETARLDRLTPLDAPTNLVTARRLVDGYESWSYSGVRGPEPGTTFWNSACVADDGTALVLQALDARRWCTRFVHEGTRVRAECGATPALVKVPGTWGYRTEDVPPLGLPVSAGEAVRSAPVAIAAGAEGDLLVDQLARLAGDAMGARRWSGPPIRGWESWYEYGLFVGADDVLENARLLRERYAHRPGFDIVQIDDGWQRTYGAWWPNERFPADLGELVRDLRALGCRPGLWIAPFRVQPGAPGVASEHPDWCIRGADGVPLVDERHGAWALDASNPEVVDWIGALGAQVRRWGFEMAKVDFCFLGALEGGRHDARVTATEALRRGMTALVDALGDGVYVLGCGMPALPAVGLCHGNRIGHDLAMPRAHQELGHPVDEGWRGDTGIRAGARNLGARWAQQSWYELDPDVVMAWGSDGADPAGYSTEEARALLTLGVVSGGPFLLADALGALDPAERGVLEHDAVLDLLDAGPFRPADVLDRADDPSVPEHAYAGSTGIAETWIGRSAGGDDTVALFNWSDRDVRRPVASAFVGAPELWTGARAGADVVVPARGARVLVRQRPSRAL
jgi:alpha-galactosidase